jgi:transcriptional regulator with XRE-family HTH domain
MAAFSNLGRYLKLKRIESGYTQAELARELGSIHSQFVSNWERGLCAPPSYSFARLISVLSINREKMVEVMVEDSKIAIEQKVYVKKSRRKSN